MSDNTQAGWYADPTGRSDHRYWNGTEWTEHVSRGGQQTVDNLDFGTDATDDGQEARSVGTDESIPVAGLGLAQAEPEPAVLYGQNTIETPALSTAPEAESGSTGSAAVAATGAPQRRRWPWIAAGVAAAFLIGLGIGAVASSKKDEVDRLEKQLAVATKERDVAQAKVNSREAKRRAHLASVAAAKAAKDEADRRAAAKVAAATKAAAAKQAADAKAAADAQAAAAAAAAAEAAKKDSFTGDGVRAVGPEINPGLWHTDGGVENCYYAILNSTDTTNIADNNNTTGPASVTLPAGKYFETSGCADWHRTG